MKLLEQVIHITVLSLVVAVAFYFFVGTGGIWGAVIMFVANFVFIGAQIAGAFKPLFPKGAEKKKEPVFYVDPKEWKE